MNLSNENNEQTTILLVEDDEYVAEMQKLLLMECCYKVIIKQNGTEAIKLAKTKKNIDIILMDISLENDMSGIEAAEKILQIREVPIIFLSTHQEPEILNKLEKVSSYGYIVKGAGISVLDTSIKMALKLYKSNQKLKELDNIIDKSNVCAFLCKTDKNWTVDFVTKNVINMLGFSDTEFLSGQVLFSDLIHPDDIKKVKNEIENKIKAGNISYKQEYRMLNKNKEIIWVEDKTWVRKDYLGNITHLECVLWNITQRKNNEKKIQTLLEEKKMLLRETHHRIKNNMNVISSILSIESAGQPEKSESKNILEESANRIISMMVLYDMLYKNEISNETDIDIFIRSLTDKLLEIHNKLVPLKAELNISDIKLPAGKASNIGIIINELFTNSVKYAFEGKKTDCKIRIDIKKKNENEIELIFADNGVGLPESITFEDSLSFGLQLINMLVKQNNGSITTKIDNGTKYIINMFL